MGPAQRTPRHEARQARTDVYRQHILAAAERVFAERGFEAAKVQEISKLARLSMGTIYAIFPSKDDLFGAILAERGRELLELARGIATQPQPPRAALRALSAAYIGYFLSHPDFLRMHLREGTSWVLGPAPGPDSRVELWQAIHELQADIFRQGIRAGVFVDEDPGYLAKLYSAMDQVLLADWVAGGMTAPREQLVQRLQELVERAFCRAGQRSAIGRPPPARQPRRRTGLRDGA
jgi:AcrR family transcriptional regulator